METSRHLKFDENMVQQISVSLSEASRIVTIYIRHFIRRQEKNSTHAIEHRVLP